MPTFTLKLIDAINGKQVFYQLVIDGVPQLDDFEKNLEKKYENDFKRLLFIMDRVSNNEHVPGTQYHLLDNKKNDPYPGCEFKSGDLRAYAFKSKAGKLVALVGYKNQQQQDIRKFNSLKKQFISQNKIPNHDQKRITK